MISFVIPTYNRSEFFWKTIDSILYQTSDNYEVIVVDDGSDADNLKEIEHICSTSNKISFYKRTEGPKGAAKCRNVGVDKAKGEFIVFLDSDDLVGPHCVSGRLNFMKENPDLDFAVFPMAIFNDDIKHADRLVNVKNEQDDLDRFLYKDHPWLITGPVWKRSAFQSIGGFDESLPSFQDYHLNLTALLEELKYKWASASPDCFYRRHAEDSIGKNNKERAHLIKQKELFVAVIKKLEERKKLTPERRGYLLTNLMQIALDLRWERLRGDSMANPGAMWNELFSEGILKKEEFESGRKFLNIASHKLLHKLPSIQHKIEAMNKKKIAEKP